ncbi:MAG: M20/M25/M40 family metallo-hydrolase [Gemmatimonadaceae bacterium]
MTLARSLALIALLPAAALAQQAAAPASSGAGPEGGAPPTRLPLKHAPRPTVPAITAGDLMTRLYIFADDSMMGREAGTEYNLKGTAYIAGELRRLGLQPAGDGGTFFQNVPLVRRSFGEGTRLAVDGQALTPGTDFLPLPGRGTPRPIDGATVVFGGSWGDAAHALTSEQVAGKLVLFEPAAGSGVATPRVRPGDPLAAAAAIAIVGLDGLSPRALSFLRQPSISIATASGSAAAPLPGALLVSRQAAERLLGAPLAGAAVGTAGKTVSGALVYTESPAPARNVVAVLRGSDPKLAGQYVAIGAHNDHVGFNHAPVDHDSLHAFNAKAWEAAGRYAGLPPLTPAQRSAITVDVAALRKTAPARPDSIANGADDDGSGSVGVLEIAEWMARSKQRPKRSVLFVWHTGEEKGLLGSRYFTDTPTVPRDSIVAQINIDMIGRGSLADTKGGGPDYLGVVGSRRLSTELGDLVESVNRSEKRPLAFDYQLDANGHPENIYCRSDHYSYARYGIPIVFFFTGLHGDYHQVTDEPQYIDYAHMARITGFIGDLTRRVADLDHRPVVDKPKPDPNGVCRQ